MKVSSRNQLFGTVTAVSAGAVNDEVEVTLQGKDKLYAVITHESVEHLGIKKGSAVWALIKASWVMLSTESNDLRISARNRLAGTVSRITEGAVNADVNVTLDGGNVITANITKNSIQRLGLQAGVKVCAVFKASSVILGTHS